MGAGQIAEVRVVIARYTTVLTARFDAELTPDRNWLAVGQAAYDHQKLRGLP